MSWNDFWFRPVDPRTLARVRGCFFAAMAFLYWRFGLNPAAWAAVDRVLWFPTGLKLLYPQLTPTAATWLWYGFLAALVLSIVSRAARWAAFLLGAYLLGLPQLTTQVDGWVLIGILGFAAAPAKAPTIWPIQLLRVSIAFVYFNAGVAKLIESGLSWASGDTLAFTIAHNASYWVADGFPKRAGWAMELVRLHWPTKIFAPAALLLELAFPLALFSRKARAVLVPSAIAFNVAAYLLMGPIFVQLVAANCIVWFG